MNETEQHCISTGGVENNGEILARDMLLTRDGVDYSITVAVQKYLEQLALEDEKYPLPEEARGDDSRIYILPDVTNVDQVCQELARHPLEELAPYITPQAPADEQTE